MLALPVFCILSYVVTCGLSAQTKVDCKQNEKLEYGRCVSCPTCRAGYGLPGRCGFGSGAGLSCQQCQENMYNADHEGNRCVPCLNCTQYNRVFKYKCRPSINAECGGCIPGYFNSYKDVITPGLYPCTGCRLRPSEPECQTTAPPTLLSSASVPVPTFGSLETPRSLSKHPGSPQRPDPGSKNKRMNQSTSTVPPAEASRQDGGNKTSIIVKAVVGSLISVLAIVVLALLLWRCKVCDRFRQHKKRKRGLENMSQNQNGGNCYVTVPIQPVTGQRNELENENTNGLEVARPATPEEQRLLTGQGEALPVGRNSGNDTYDGASRQSDNRAPTEDSPNDSELGESTRSSEELGGDQSCRNSTSSAEVAALSADVNKCSNASAVPNGNGTIVFNGPTTVKIGAQQIGHHQNLGPSSTDADVESPEQRKLPEEDYTHAHTESSQRYLPTEVHPLNEVTELKRV